MIRCKFILAFSFSCLYLVALGQRSDKYNESLWSLIDLEPSKKTVQKSDTMFVIATTRRYEKDSNRKFQDCFESPALIRHLLVVKFSGRWKLFSMDSLEEAFSYLKPNKDIVVYVEGMGKTFTTNLYRSAGLALQYDVNVIMFDYPSANISYSNFRNFHLSKDNSNSAAPLYSQLLKSIQLDQQNNKSWVRGNDITLFHHSMGNRMLKRLAVEHMADSLKKLTITSLVLNAACVEQKKHQDWINQLSFATAIIINYNPKDMQLKAARFITCKRQLGQSKNKSTSNQIRYVNLCPYIGRRHSAFLNKPGAQSIPPSLFNFYNDLFHGKP